MSRFTCSLSLHCRRMSFYVNIQFFNSHLVVDWRMHIVSFPFDDVCKSFCELLSACVHTYVRENVYYLFVSLSLQVNYALGIATFANQVVVMRLKVYLQLLLLMSYISTV